MMRQALAVISIIAALSAYCQGRVSHCIDAPASSLVYHYRVKLKTEKRTETEIRWNYTEPASYRFARVISNRSAYDDFWPEAVEIEVGQTAHGHEQILETHTVNERINTYDSGLSLRLSCGRHSGTLEIGSKKVSGSFKIPYDNMYPDSIVAICSENHILKRNDLNVTYCIVPEYSSFADITSLVGYMSESTDKYEGLWIYYDRITSPLHSSSGGKYLLATVKTDSGYDIIYVDGATSNATDWKPLRIKGRMTEATFIGSFDLQWIDAEGFLLDYETSASMNGDLFTVSFPHWKSEMRFRRVSPDTLNIEKFTK